MHFIAMFEVHNVGVDGNADGNDDADGSGKTQGQARLRPQERNEGPGDRAGHHKARDHDQAQLAIVENHIGTYQRDSHATAEQTSV